MLNCFKIFGMYGYQILQHKQTTRNLHLKFINSSEKKFHEKGEVQAGTRYPDNLMKWSCSTYKSSGSATELNSLYIASC